MAGAMLDVGVRRDGGEVARVEIIGDDVGAGRGGGLRGEAVAGADVERGGAGMLGTPLDESEAEFAQRFRAPAHAVARKDALHGWRYFFRKA
jgi:hypothetical protein